MVRLGIYRQIELTDCDKLVRGLSGNLVQRRKNLTQKAYGTPFLFLSLFPSVSAESLSLTADQWQPIANMHVD
ncbi:hypothetical protein Nepgr_030409 [Nepenthes gracilis]|uniref:Uncharacterized protein n=1 Tax=Nepenthes gracilis TaxID=150966 RepID=A0AAD3TGL7_NEPGR|nr:hypothetical protein Nepgr_030409 [Nepenthes gracilis]